ncbi:hypothetical protein GP486_004021 [Trichoglossum hirsutum]|uniref:Uncharacterized protein n=1 Tax=Trichoglossum hirsutum TaxID=265104 RepID=A0A9P8LBY4_9PEZI|nr:hypothetical protein GP486_004021 [Trichoglossum hirsutum]
MYGYVERFRRSPAWVKVSLGLRTSIALSLDECDVSNRTLLDHVIWRVEGQSIVRIATEPVGFSGKIFRPQLDAIIDEVIPYALQQLSSNPFDAIRSKVFGAAYNKSTLERTSGNILLTNALRIWAAQTTFFKNYWRVVDGAESVKAPYYPPLRAALVPRMLYLQLEQIMEAYMKELEQEFLHNLENMIFSRDSAQWFPTYLATFVYLSTLEGDTWDLWEWREKYGVQEVPDFPDSQREFWPRTADLSVHIDRNHHQASVITSHAIAALGKGQLPFSMNSAGKLVAATRDQGHETHRLAAELAEEFRNLGNPHAFHPPISPVR